MNPISLELLVIKKKLMDISEPPSLKVVRAFAAELSALSERTSREWPDVATLTTLGEQMAGASKKILDTYDSRPWILAGLNIPDMLFESLCAAFAAWEAREK